MSIDTIIMIVVGGFIPAVGYLLKRQLVDHTDRIEQKLDDLIDTVSDMKEQNAIDHGEVKERIANIEGRLSNFEARQKRSKPKRIER